MEKYSQFRDRGSGVAPFLPLAAHSTGMSLSLPLHLFLVSIRLPLFFTVFATYFLLLQWLPIGPLGKKASLWSILGIPGIWWIDLQIDGVRRGSLGKQTASRLPQAGTVIASSFTSPIDALYLAAIFDPVFTISYPSTHKVRQISLLEAILRAFAKPELLPPTTCSSQLLTLEQLLQRNPDRVIAVFPECTTTNGKGILRLSPSLVSAGAGRKVYPVSLRYTPADITTPVPRAYCSFLWYLLRKPTHCIRVRIAEHITVAHSATASNSAIGRSTSTAEGGEVDDLDLDLLASLNGSEKAIAKSKTATRDDDFEASMNSAQKELLAQVGESLARLARVRRVGLGAKEKMEFAEMWARKEGKLKRL